MMVMECLPNGNLLDHLLELNERCVYIDYVHDHVHVYNLYIMCAVESVCVHICMLLCCVWTYMHSYVYVIAYHHSGFVCR